MANCFADKPALPPIVLKNEWVCPVTGLSVPKDPMENLLWRKEICDDAEQNEEIRQALYTACSQSVLFFINTFVFTLRVFEPRKDGSGQIQQAENKHLPFVTWPIQDEHILRIENAIDDGESLLTDKSRDMGATWDHIAVFVHRLLFREDESHLLISRKEDAVDLLSGTPKSYPFGPLADPGTLFGKIDYILNRLPEWMLPRISRKSMHILNLDNKTRIDGESCNPTAGSSDRRDSIFLDEMAKMQWGASVKQSTKDVTACRLPCSTPHGAGTAFSKWRGSGQIPVFVMGWWDHPEKGKDRHAESDDLGRWKIHSPWYDQRCAEDSPKEIATELDMDHIGSGDTFFEATIIEQHKRLFGKPARRVTEITFKRKLTDEAIQDAIRRRDRSVLRAGGQGGAWQIWCELPNGCPDQTRTYALCIDISKGQGASNSTINAVCLETREKVAAFADANTPPHELARLACAAAIWFGGRTRPLVIWENNGDPGFDFGRQITNAYRYPNIYFDRAAGTLREKVGKRYGWRSSPEKKAAALGALRRAYAHGRYINHDSDSLDEALTYIHYEGGGIGPAALVEESDSARKAHGDRVIADMLCIVALGDVPKSKSSEQVGPANSIGGRMKLWRDAKRHVDRDHVVFSEVA